MTRVAHFRYGWGFRERWPQALAEIRRAVADAGPLALIGSRSLVTPWPALGTSPQGWLEAALRLDFGKAHWASVFCARNSYIVGPFTLGIERAGVLAESIREQPVKIAMQVIEVFAIHGRLQVGWAGFRALASWGGAGLLEA